MFSTFHSHYLGGGEDESGGEGEKDEKECGIPHCRGYGEKKVGKSVVERWM